jgi:hypothetical protein
VKVDKNNHNNDPWKLLLRRIGRESSPWQVERETESDPMEVNGFGSNGM